MSDLARQAQAAAQKLLTADETQLYEALGLRARAIAEDPTKAGSFEPQVTYDQAVMGLSDDLLRLGRRLFRRWNAEAYKLVCGADPEDQQDRKQLAGSFGVGDAVVAGLVTSLLVTNLGMAPALATVVAALAVKRFFRPGYEEFCEVWRKNLPEA
jgi:hypothetical protein